MDETIDKEALFASKLEQMQQKFTESLPSRLAEVQEFWLKVKANEDVVANIETLHRLVHTLTGSAGTFAHVNLSQHSRALEIVLLELKKEQVSQVSAEQTEQIECLLTSIEECQFKPVSKKLFDDSVLPSKKNSPSAKILVLDDDKEFGDYLTSQLQHFGYQTFYRESLDTLYDDILEFKPDLIIADISFPEGDMAGVDELGKYDIKKSFGIEIPFIFVSSRQDIEARLEAVRIGGSAYLTKPVNISVILENVRQLTQTEDEEACRILVVDDDEALVNLITFVIEQSGLYVEGVTEPQKVLEYIACNKPDLILMDINMPWCNGIELAQVIRQQPNLAGIPIIFLSSEKDEDLQFNAVLQGGDDFLNKPIDINRLSNFVKVKAQRARMLNSMMVKDGLTGLFNHAYIKEFLESELLRSQRSHSFFSTVMLDVDFFKKVNDTYGHTVGDQVLRSLAHFLTQRLRQIDKVARYGGEEFIVFLPETSAEEAEKLFSEILHDFNQVEHFTQDGERFNVSYSAGVIANNQADNINDLLKRVDEALYQAKRQGRNQVVTFQD